MFHFTPYTIHWHPSPLDLDKHKQIYSNTCTVDAMLQAQTEVDNLPQQEGDTRECIAFGIMLASDSTQLTSFGTASELAHIPHVCKPVQARKGEAIMPYCASPQICSFGKSYQTLTNCITLTSITAWQQLYQLLSREDEASAKGRSRGPLQA
jgi:hypothetical protein